jgi:hypothetical protein
MDPTLLVDKDIATGRKLAELLKKSSDLRVQAAFWWQEDSEWRFIVATPVVPKRGRLVAHEKIREAMGAKAKSKEFQPILDRLDTLSPNEGVMSALNTGSLGEIPLHRRIVDEGVRGAYLHGAYFYYFAPRNLAAA